MPKTKKRAATAEPESSAETPLALSEPRKLIDWGVILSLVSIAVAIVVTKTAEVYLHLSAHTRLLIRLGVSPENARLMDRQTWIAVLFSISTLFILIGIIYYVFYWRLAQRAYRYAVQQDALAEVSKTGVFTYDPSGYVSSANAEMLRIWGVEEGQVVGQRNVFTFAPFVEAGLNKFFRESLDGTARQRETALTTLSGGSVWRSFHTSPVFDGKGAIVRVLVLAADITERRRLEEALKSHAEQLETMVRQRTEQLFEAQRRLFTVLDAMPLIMCATDKEGIFTLSMGKGLEGLGLVPGEAVGKKFNDLFGEYPKLVEMHRRAEHGETVESVADLGAKRCLVHFAPQKDANGVVTGVHGVAVDVAEVEKKANGKPKGAASS